MKKFKNLGIVFVLIFLIGFSANISVMAATKKSSDYSKTCIVNPKEGQEARSVNNVYELGIDYTSNGIYNLTCKHSKLKIVSIEEGMYDSTSNSFKPVELEHLATDYDSLIGKVIKPSSGKVSVQVKEFDQSTTDSDAFRIVRVNVELVESDDYCQSREDYESSENGGMFTGHYDLPLTSFAESKPTLYDNTNYDSPACRAIRDGNNSSGVIKSSIWEKYKSAGRSRYQQLVGFCFSRQQVENVYTNDQVLDLVSKAITSYYYEDITRLNNANYSSGPGDFETFKNRAIGAGGDHYHPNVSSSGEIYTNTLKCDFDFSKSGNQLLVGVEDEKYQYTNEQYYYGSQVTIIPIESNYKLHYNGNDDKASKEESVGYCKRTCEESVKVEYGPPQVVIAGFCFQYQVKVTSYVKCTSDTSGLVLPPVPTSNDYCQPKPHCYESGLPAEAKNAQAGPNEDFDECISNCDGGIYSQSCSKKCYQKVYLSNSNNLNLLANTSGRVEFMYGTNKRCTPKCSVSQLPQGGEYVRDSSGTIRWVSNKSYNTYAQWYIDQNSWFTLIEDKNCGCYHEYFKPDSNGFKRAYYTNGTVCGSRCKYINCDNENKYLNSTDSVGDYLDNIQIYDDAVRKCAAQTSCSTRTAYFQISASYKDKNTGKNYTVYYPFEDSAKVLEGNYSDSNITKGDKLNSSGSGKTLSLLDFGGCYQNANQRDNYRSEWSFPGTWINNKTGDISFITPNNKTAWHQSKNTFCLPLNVADTNVKWWNYYFKQRSGSVPFSSSGSYLQSPAKDKCDAIKNASKPTDGEIDWNIHARALTFGYFGWKFNIDCFYAANSNSSLVNDNSCTVTPGEGGYEAKTITPNDLFPSDDPNGKETIIASNAANTGRTPGFNWTSAATIPKTKNDYYGINPVLLIEKIQRLGTKVYDKRNEDEQLDYEFKLSIQDLKNIRKVNQSVKDSNGYLEWFGESKYDTDHKLYIYYSGLFRNGINQNRYSVIADRSKAIKLGLLGCNNQLNKDACDSLV